MDVYVKKEQVYDILSAIHERVWEVDIPSPTTPEYIEHHRDCQSIMKLIKEKLDMVEQEPGLKLVRCKDCKHVAKDSVFGKYWCQNQKCFRRKVTEDFYCGLGERKEHESY